MHYAQPVLRWIRHCTNHQINYSLTKKNRRLPQCTVIGTITDSFLRAKSKKQIWPWSTDEAGQKLIEFCQDNALVTAKTLFQQHRRRLYTWTSPDSQYWNQVDYILCSQRWRSSIQSAKTRPGADCGSDHELLIAKFRLKLKSRENH